MMGGKVETGFFDPVNAMETGPRNGWGKRDGMNDEMFGDYFPAES
jgi:hypothetical protein